MKIKFWAISLLLFCGINSSLAQEKDQKPLPISLSYFGNNLLKPGFRASVRPFPWTNNGVSANPKRFKFVQEVSFGYFATPKTNHTLFITTDPGIALTFRKGFKIEAFLGVGYMRIFNLKTYEVTDTGIEKVPFASRGYFTSHLTFGIGKDLFPKREIPWAWHIRPSFYLVAPYNSGINILLNFEFGLTYILNGGKKDLVKD